MAANRSLVMLETDTNFQDACSSEQTQLQVIELKNEPASIAAYAFSKNSKYIEKALRITEFLAAEHLKYERSILMSQKMMPTPMRSYSLNILFADTYKLFISYALSLVFVTLVFFVEISVAKFL